MRLNVSIKQIHFGFASNLATIKYLVICSVLETVVNAAIKNPYIDYQFSIGSVMCTTGTFAVLLTYLKTFATDDFLAGLWIVGGIAFLGCICGCIWQRALEMTLWATLGAMTAFLCAVGEPLPDQTFSFAWPLVGATTATSAILLEKEPLWRRMCAGAFVALGIMGAFSIAALSRGGVSGWQEVACGPLAGAIMVGVVWLLEVVRQWNGYSHATMVFVLTLGVVSGNVFGRWIGWL